MTGRDIGVVPVFDETESGSLHSRSSSASSAQSAAVAAENVAAFFLYGTGHESAGGGAVRTSRGNLHQPSSSTEREALQAAVALHHRSEAMQRVSRYFRHRGALPFEQSAVLFPAAAEALMNNDGPLQACDDESDNSHRGVTAPAGKVPTAQMRADDRSPATAATASGAFRSGGAGTTALDLLSTQASRERLTRTHQAPLEVDEATMTEPAVAAAVTALGDLGINDTRHHHHRHAVKGHTTSNCALTHRSDKHGSTSSPTKSRHTPSKRRKLTSVVNVRSSAAVGEEVETAASTASVGGSSTARGHSTGHSRSRDDDKVVRDSRGGALASLAEACVAESAVNPVHALLPTFSAMEERQLFDESASDAGDQCAVGGVKRGRVQVDAELADSPHSSVTVFPTEADARRYYTQDMEEKVGDGGVPTLRAHLYFEQPNGLFVDRRAHSRLEQQRGARVAQQMAEEAEEKRKQGAWDRLHRGRKRLAMLDGGGGGGGRRGSGGNQSADAAPVAWEDHREDAVFYRLYVLSLLRYLNRLYYYLSAFTCGVAVFSLILATAPALGGTEDWDVRSLNGAVDDVHAMFPSRVALTVALLSVFNPGLFLFLSLVLLITGLAPLVWSVAEGQWIAVRVAQREKLVGAAAAVEATTAGHSGTDLTEAGQPGQGLSADSHSDVFAGSVSGARLASRERRRHASSSSLGSAGYGGRPHAQRRRRQTGWPGAHQSRTGEDSTFQSRDSAGASRYIGGPQHGFVSPSRGMGVSMPSLAQRRVSARASLVPVLQRHYHEHARQSFFARGSDADPFRTLGVDEANSGGGLWGRPSRRSPSVSFSMAPPGGYGGDIGGGRWGTGSHVFPSARGSGDMGTSSRSVTGVVAPTTTTTTTAVPGGVASPTSFVAGGATAENDGRGVFTGLAAAWQGTLTAMPVPEYYTQALSFVLDGTLHADNVITRVLEDAQRRVVAACFGRSWTAQSFWVLFQPRHWLCLICLALTVTELAMVDEQSIVTLLFGSELADKKSAARSPVTVVLAIICTRAALFTIIWLLNVFF